MRERTTALAVALGLAVAGIACSSPEKNVVNQYFGALRANDQGTLTSFAMVAFDQKVDDFKVLAVGPEAKSPATLPDLVKKVAGTHHMLRASGPVRLVYLAVVQRGVVIGGEKLLAGDPRA